MQLILTTHKLPVMSWEWWRCIEIQDSRWSRLKCQTPTSFQGEVKEQHRPLQLAEVFLRWAPCRFASLEFHELRGTRVLRLSEKKCSIYSIYYNFGKLYRNKQCMRRHRFCLLSKERSNFAGIKWQDGSMHCSGTHSGHFTCDLERRSLDFENKEIIIQVILLWLN